MESPTLSAAKERCKEVFSQREPEVAQRVSLNGEWVLASPARCSYLNTQPRSNS